MQKLSMQPRQPLFMMSSPRSRNPTILWSAKKVSHCPVVKNDRVAIARTLLKDPRILILDDSTSSVDTETEAEIHAALENLMKARTTFIIAHRIQSIMNADLILVLDKGRIIQRGTHAQLLKREGIYRKIFDIQTRIEVELEKEIAHA